MRVIVAPGTGQTLSLRQKGEPSIHVLLEAVTPRPNLALTLKTVGFYRQEPKLKHTNYFAAFVAMTAAAKQGFDDILHTDAAPNPRLVEISRNNIVFIKDTTLLAPNKDIYPGLIREVLLHRAHEAGLKVVERDVLASELDTIDAVFATGVTYGPRPVIAIDQHRFASDTHEAFTHLHQIYLDALRANV
jgi:branched-subunit amino acid aminotransferase/4-amino-4-deoxychorismate lyase